LRGVYLQVSRARMDRMRPTPDFGFRIQGWRFGVHVLGSRDSDFGFLVSGFGSLVSGFGCEISDPGVGFEISGLWFRDSGLNFRVPGSRFKVWSLGCEVSGSGVKP